MPNNIMSKFSKLGIDISIEDESSVVANGSLAMLDIIQPIIASETRIQTPQTVSPVFNVPSNVSFRTNVRNG